MTRELYHNLDAGSRQGVEVAKDKMKKAKQESLVAAKEAKEFAKNTAAAAKAKAAKAN